MSLSTEEYERFSRQISLLDIGEKGQVKLKAAKILIVGVGGLGSPIALYAVAAGIGNIVLVDDDVVSISNLQRQILYDETELGSSKVNCAKRKLLKLNKDVNIEIYNECLTKENAFRIANKCDLIIDACDNAETRYLMNDLALGLNIPYLYASICEYYGQVSLFNTHKDASTYRCVFPESNNSKNLKEGVIGCLPAIVGSIQLNEAIKWICNSKSSLSEKLLNVDLQSLDFFKLNISVSQKERAIGLSNFKENIHPHY